MNKIKMGEKEMKRKRMYIIIFSLFTTLTIITSHITTPAEALKTKFKKIKNKISQIIGIESFKKHLKSEKLIQYINKTTNLLENQAFKKFYNTKEIQNYIQSDIFKELSKTTEIKHAMEKTSLDENYGPSIGILGILLFGLITWIPVALISLIASIPVSIWTSLAINYVTNDPILVAFFGLIAAISTITIGVFWPLIFLLASFTD